jgi:hypothetical protein
MAGVITPIERHLHRDQLLTGGNMKTEAGIAHPGVFVDETLKNPPYQAYQLLHWGFVLVPIVAGLDKFFMKLTDWTMYLWHPLSTVFGSAETFMHVVGGIEILAGCLIAFKPKIGAPIVAAWLVGIIVNLLLLGSYYDIALRDLGLFVAAVALWRLSLTYDHGVQHMS